MNKLAVDGVTRGFPFKLDDITFMSDAFAEAIKGFCSAFGENFILSGCDLTSVRGITSTTFTMSSGYIVLNREVLPVNTHSIVLANSAIYQLLGLFNDNYPLYWRVVESNDSNGERNLKYGGTHNSHKVRRAALTDQYIINGTLPSVGGVKKINEVLMSKVSAVTKDELSNAVTYLITPNTGWQNSSVLTPYITKTNLNLVNFQFSFINLSATNSTIFTLPSSVRPLNPIYQSYEGGYIYIGTNGEVRYSNLSLTNSSIFAHFCWYTN